MCDGYRGKKIDRERERERERQKERKRQRKSKIDVLISLKCFPCP